MPSIFSQPEVKEQPLPDPNIAKQESLDEEKARERARRVAVRQQSTKGLRQLRTPTETADVAL